MQTWRANGVPWHRRGFLHVGAASALGLGLSQILRRQADAGAAETNSPAAHEVKSVIMIWLAGGPPTIDMWDMKPDAPDNIRGEFAPMATSADGIQVCEHLPKLAQQMKHACLVRSCHHTLAAHGPGSQLVMTGNKPRPSMDFPSLGSIVSYRRAAVSGVPTNLSLGEVSANAGYLGAAHNPFPCEPTGGRIGPARASVGLPDGFEVDDLDRRDKLLAKFDQRLADLDRTPLVSQLDKFQQQAIDILRSDKTRIALDLSPEPDQMRETYGRGALGMRLLAARRLVEAGVQFITVGMSGWDTHSNNFGTLRNQLLPQLDRALAGLIEDLRQRGLLSSTLVYCTGEFGRTPAVNGAAGRDHWARAMCPLLAGGKLRAGYAHGATDEHGSEPKAAPCSPMDVSATVLQSIGIAHNTLLMTPSSRPLPAISEGRPIADLLV